MAPDHGKGPNDPREVPVASDPIRRALEEDQDWYRDLVEHSHDLLCVHDLKGRFLSVNPVAARLLGYSVEEMLQTPMRDFVAPQFRSQFEAYLREIERTGESRGLLAVVTQSGEKRIWEYHNTLRTEGVETPIVRGMAHDVTERVRAEKALRVTNQELLKTAAEREGILHDLTLFRSLLDQSNDVILVLDPKTLRFLDVNQTACVALGYSREELLSMTVFDIDQGVDERFRARMEQRLRQSGCATIERVHRRKDGTTFPVEVNMKSVQLDRDYCVAVARDITERRRAEEKLYEFERVVENLDEMILVVGRDYRYVLVNRAYLSYRGMTKEEVVGHSVVEVMNPRLYETVVKGKLDECFQGKVVNYELKQEYPEMGERDLAITYLPVLGSGGIDRVACIFRDITERKRAEESLRESERRQQLALQIGKIGAFELNLDSGRGTWTAEFAEIWGIPSGFAGNFGALFRWEQVHPEDRARVQAELAQLMQSREEGESEFRVARPDGVMRWIRGRGRVIEDTATGPLRIVGVNMDITERKRTEEALRESEGQFRLFVEHAPAGLAMLDREMRYLHVSLRWRIDYGLGDRDLRGVSHYEVFPEIPERWKQAHRRALAGEVLREENDRFDRADGSVMWQRWELRPWHDKTGGIGGIVIFAEDVTARKQAEDALRESEERFRVALKNSPTAVFNLDRDLRYTWMYNPQLPRSVGEHLGKTAGDLFDPEGAARLTEVRRRVLETGVGVRDEMQLIYGGRKHYFDSTIEPVLDSAGAVIGLTGASTDVTQLHEVTEKLRAAQQKLTEEKLYLEQEINTELGFDEIVGQSKILKGVMEQAASVAPSDATALLLGETGTGKELIARAIHGLSKRQGESFIKMNCAAIPEGLLESELFGYEKGAFTGAAGKKAGRVELADKGTLFLDEIGDIPLALQPKLLRLLQDHEFERLGGTQTLKSDFRLIAATNRDLLHSVNEGEFRSDLYYRLRVFPIHLPSLRERRDDIPLLVEHFVRKCARRMNKSITSIPTKTMRSLTQWDWPGNIRELENFVERSVILTNGSVLACPLGELSSDAETSTNDTLEEVERKHILDALRESRGQLSGPTGAAARLGLKRTTLQSKLKQLGIDHRLYRNDEKRRTA